MRYSGVGPRRRSAPVARRRATRDPRSATHSRRDEPPLHSATMKIAHVREVNAPAGAAWRLAAALDGAPEPASLVPPTEWLDLEIARRRAVAADPRLGHNSALHPAPLTTLDDLLAAGSRGAAPADLGSGFIRRRARADDEARRSAVGR